MTTTGFLHPGAMGATVAAACRGKALRVSADRSPATRARAERAGLVDARTIADLAEIADVIVSVCPPGSAEAVAREVADAGYRGVFVDANAVSPVTVRRIAERFDRFVDGGIIGPPAQSEGTTRLYLCGPDAPAFAGSFAGSVLEARVMDGEIGAASALKMAYAAWTKGSGAMLYAVRALAEAERVVDPLMEEWNLSQPGLAARAQASAPVGAPKAWRFVDEMEEIAATFAAAGLPDGFHRAAADVFRTLAGFKDTDDVTIDQVVARLLDEDA